MQGPNASSNKYSWRKVLGSAAVGLAKGLRAVSLCSRLCLSQCLLSCRRLVLEAEAVRVYGSLPVHIMRAEGVREHINQEVTSSVYLA